MAYQFFISYASKDAKSARAVCTLLKHPGLTCWIAPGSIPPGESHVRAIPKAIRESDAVVVLFSRAADESDDVMSEITLARKYKKRIVPVRIENYEPGNLEYHLGVRQWVDFYGSRRAEGRRTLERLVSDVCGPREAGSTDASTAPDEATLTAPEPTAAPSPSPRRTGTVAPPPRRARRSKDPEEEYEQLRERLEKAKADSAERMWDRAASYCRRKKPDFKLARQWFVKAASAGKTDGAAERQLYEDGVAAGSTDAMVSLGLLLELGDRVPSDIPRAMHLYEKAAASGDTDAMCRLGVLAMKGTPPNPTPNYTRARGWLERAAARGNADAMWEMGNWFSQKNDRQNARLWYDRASAHRRAPAAGARGRKARGS